MSCSRPGPGGGGAKRGGQRGGPEETRRFGYWSRAFVSPSPAPGGGDGPSQPGPAGVRGLASCLGMFASPGRKTPSGLGDSARVAAWHPGPFPNQKWAKEAKRPRNQKPGRGLASLERTIESLRRPIVSHNRSVARHYPSVARHYPSVARHYPSVARQYRRSEPPKRVVQNHLRPALEPVRPLPGPRTAIGFRGRRSGRLLFVSPGPRRPAPDPG